MTENPLRGTSSATRTLDQRQLEALRPVPSSSGQPKRKRDSTSRAGSEISSGIVCYCGERFAEHQALEFMLHLRAEVGVDLQAIERVRAKQRRYQARPEIKARKAEWRRRYMAAHPEAAARYAAQQKEYRQRPEVKARHAAREAARRARQRESA